MRICINTAVRGALTMKRRLPRIDKPLDSCSDDDRTDDDCLSHALPKSNVTAGLDLEGPASSAVRGDDYKPIAKLPRSHVTVEMHQQPLSDDLCSVWKLPKHEVELDNEEPSAHKSESTGRATHLASTAVETRSLVLGSDSGVLGDLHTLLANKHSAIEARASELMDLILKDTSPMALRPKDPLQLEETLKVVLSLQANSYTSSIMAQDNGSNWAWWKKWW